MDMDMEFLRGKKVQLENSLKFQGIGRVPWSTLERKILGVGSNWKNPLWRVNEYFLEPNILVWKINIFQRKMEPCDSMQTLHFPLRPCIFHQTLCFPHTPVPHTPCFLQTPGPHTPDHFTLYPMTLGFPSSPCELFMISGVFFFLLLPAVKRRTPDCKLIHCGLFVSVWISYLKCDQRKIFIEDHTGGGGGASGTVHKQKK